MRTLQKIGFALFLAGVLVFIGALSLSDYELTDQSFKASIQNESHRELMQPVLIRMKDKTYSSSVSFIADFKENFNQINDRLKENQDWNHIIWTDYTFAIVKNSTVGAVKERAWVFFIACFILSGLGALMYLLPKLITDLPGIRNNGIFFSATSNRGWIGISLGILLIVFYIVLYEFPQYISNWVIMLDPLSVTLSGGEADQWFLYGFIYTLAMSVMGVRMMIKYRNNMYQIVRTISLVFFQLCFAFTLPQILRSLNKPAYDLKSIWPLEYTFFFDYRLDEQLAAGTLGISMLVWGIALFAIIVPVLTYFYGKRWYCSWVCGCGGLAETVGDPFRQLSDKSLKSWKIERYVIHSVLVFSVVMTSAVLYSYFTGSSKLLGISTMSIREQYGFLIGFAFAGVVGTGFYPLMGNRMWCRFGCPLAAYLGIIQRFKSRFRITTNGGQCISCGNCSTYCEMGIDVRWYAQRGQNIVRSSCVGCGVCSAVCPRGVLKLENGPVEGRINEDPILIGANSIELNV